MNDNLLFLLIFSVFIGGCKTAPEYQRPVSELPDGWAAAATDGKTALGAQWWTLYGDAALDAMVNEALQHNQDLALATARLDEARALARVADAGQMPSVDAGFDRNRSRSSERSSIPLPPSVPLERNSYRGQLNVSYEIDLWGRLSGAAQAARAEMLASAAARETVRITLTAEVVQTYYALIALDAQVATTKRSLSLREDNLRLQRVRAQAGLINDFALRQLEAEVAAAQAQLPALERRRSSTELALGVLLGRSPRAIVAGPGARADDTARLAVPVVPEGLPSELLLRRPDIVQAEQQLIAANARIGAARAALFPRIVLSGYYGSDSAALSNLFTSPARIWQLGFALAQPIFQGGRLFGEIEAVEARERQAVAQYLKTLQTAFRETQDALIAQSRTREIFDAESARAVALTDALRLARIRYENGLTSQLEVLDAERNLLSAELNRADALRGQRAAVADVVKALGGGWTGFSVTASANTEN